jgi:hypothetical protein
MMIDKMTVDVIAVQIHIIQTICAVTACSSSAESQIRPAAVAAESDRLLKFLGISADYPAGCCCWGYQYPAGGCWRYPAGGCWGYPAGCCCCGISADIRSAAVAAADNSLISGRLAAAAAGADIWPAAAEACIRASAVADICQAAAVVDIRPAAAASDICSSSSRPDILNIWPAAEGACI